MYRSKVIAYNDITDTSKELVKNFCRLLSETLIKTYFIGGKGILTLSPSEEINDLMEYFINELFGEWGAIEYFNESVVNINLTATGFNNSLVMNVRYIERGQEAIVIIKYFDDICKAEYIKVREVTSNKLNRVIMLSTEDLLQCLKDTVFLRYSINH